jgi:signal transduction histidine kinase
MTCYALIHRRETPCDGADHPCPLQQVKDTRGPVTVEHIHYDLEGNARCVEVHGHPIVDRSGEVVRIIEYSFDITERKQMQETMQQAAAAAERQRLARDLHDAVTQTLFSATLIAEALPQVWERAPDEGRRGLRELRELTRGALAELRTLLLELRPAALTERPLDDLLPHLTRAMAARLRVPVTLEIEGDCTLPGKVQIALYRITQEALNNVAKHAGASQVEVALCCEAGRATLSIEDDGSGFEMQDVLPDRLGLGIMRERAERIGAACEISSSPGLGTHVFVGWPAQGDGGA